MTRPASRGATPRSPTRAETRRCGGDEGVPTFHPWRRLRDLGSVELGWVVMPGRLGETDGSDRIRLHPHQSQAQRRSTLAHELAHIELGHTAGCTPHDERAARELAARWLVPLESLVDAARWAQSLDELAEELWVDVDTVRTRLAVLDDEERCRLDHAGAEVERA